MFVVGEVVVARRALMGLVGCGAYVGLFAQRMAFGAFYTATETVARPGSPPMAMLVFLTRAAEAGGVAADFAALGGAVLGAAALLGGFLLRGALL